MQQQPPNYAPPQYYQQQPPQPKNQSMKVASIILFALGFCLHILSFFPLIGLVFGIFAFCCYLLAFVFLCLI